MTTTLPDQSDANAKSQAWRPWLGVAVLIAAMTVMRLVYAGALDLRTDEAYSGPGRRKARCPSSTIRP